MQLFPHKGVSSGFVGKEVGLERFLVCSMAGYFPVADIAANGNIAAIVRWGDIHIGQLGSLGIVESFNGGESWTRLRQVGPDAVDVRNPAFGILSDGTWLLSYIEMDCYQNGYWKPNGLGVFPINVIRSTDAGKTWSSPFTIDPVENKLCSPYGKIIQDQSGNVLLSIYGDNEVFLYRSSDGGKTWGEFTKVAKGYNETAFLVASNGDLIAFLRTGELAEGAGLRISRSSDDGYTWTDPKYLCGAERHPADAIRLIDGKIILTYSNRRVPFGVHALVSIDDGHTWETNKILALTADSSTWDCGYPSSVQLPDGRILTLYYAIDSMGTIKNGERYPLALHCGAVRYSADHFFS